MFGDEGSASYLQYGDEGQEASQRDEPADPVVRQWGSEQL
jgi:hypothetical protein